MKSEFSGYVLAGGRSSRMGTDKAFLEFGGECLVERAVSTLKIGGENRVRVVINQNQAAKYGTNFPQFEYVLDIFPERGALGGIHAALKNCTTEFAIVLAVDLPFVDENAIKSLCEIAVNSEDFSAIVPRQNDGRLQPLCAVYRAKNCLPRLEEILLKDENSSVRDFLEKIETRVIDSTNLSDDRDLFVNVNFRADFERLNTKENSGFKS